MSLSDVFLLVVRWLHLVSAAAWIGGSLFYLLVLRPAARKTPESFRALSLITASEFRGLVDTSIIVLLLTGVILTLNRLTPGVVGAPYVIVLAVKIALSLWMFVLARSRRRRSNLIAPTQTAEEPKSTRFGNLARAVSGYNAIVILGIIVFLLADLLKALFEMAIS